MKQLEQIRLENELAEHHANPNTYSARNLPATWESKNKYGEDFLTIRDEDREEIEGALGIIDQSECLICELQTSATPEGQLHGNQPDRELLGATPAGRLNPANLRLQEMPAKKHDLANYFDPAKLTDKQRECASLRLEHEWKDR